jgi:L-amino acid N-acyltransferase YncA
VTAEQTGARALTGIVIRPAAPEDSGAICAIYAPVVGTTAISFEESAPDPAEISRRMLASPRLPWLVAEDSGRVAGYAYASAHRPRAAYRWSADSSIYLDEQFRSRGLGRLLYERLIGEVRELGYVSLFAGIALPNAASVGLHEALGFQPVGVFRNVGFKHGSWHDVGWWQRPLRDAAPSPVEPRTWQPGG